MCYKFKKILHFTCTEYNLNYLFEGVVPTFAIIIRFIDPFNRFPYYIRKQDIYQRCDIIEDSLSQKIFFDFCPKNKKVLEKQGLLNKDVHLTSDFVFGGQNDNSKCYLFVMCCIVSFARSEILTVPTPKIEV